MMGHGNGCLDGIDWKISGAGLTCAGTSRARFRARRPRDRLRANERERLREGSFMRIGVPREIKTHEYRVGLVPGSARELIHRGHEVMVETGAGAGIGFPDQAYLTIGAKVLPSAAAVFAEAELVVKVKEPQPQEIALLRKGQVLFTYLHLAADKAQAQGLARQGVTA